jgi:putative peptide zinc metalloprotease protein
MSQMIKTLFARTSVKVVVAALAVLMTGVVVQATEFVGGEGPDPTPTPAVAASNEAAEASPTEPPAQSAAAPDQAEPTERPATAWEESDDGNVDNIVRVMNRNDDRFRARASVRLTLISGDEVAPRNYAWAQASCRDCQTFAIAFQVVLYERGAHYVAPENAAIALNIGCSHCFTAALATQYVIPVDDIDAVPTDVDRMVKAMDREFRAIEGLKSTREMSIDEAISRIEAVKARFKALGAYLRESYRERVTEGEASPSPTDAASEAPSSAPSAPAETAPAATPEPTPDPTPHPVTSS